MEYFLFFAVFLGLCFITVSAWPMGQETFGNDPLPEQEEYKAWPGIMPLINDDSRVYSNWVNGNEHFYYGGDTVRLNDFLSHFAAMESPVHEVILRPGPEYANSFNHEKSIPVRWRLHLVGGIVRGMVAHEGTAGIWDKHPTLTIYITDTDSIQLDAVVLPEKVTVLQLSDLRKKYQDGLRDKNVSVRRDAATFLAEEDGLHEENVPLLETLLKEGDAYARTVAAVALGRFGKLAASALPALRTAAADADRQVSTMAASSIEKIENGKDLAAEVATSKAMETRIAAFVEKIHVRKDQTESMGESAR